MYDFVLFGAVFRHKNTLQLLRSPHLQDKNREKVEG